MDTDSDHNLVVAKVRISSQGQTKTVFESREDYKMTLQHRITGVRLMQV